MPRLREPKQLSLNVHPSPCDLDHAQRRRPRPRPARTAIAILAMAAVALLLAACSGSPSSNGSGGSSNAGGSTHAKELAFSRCMRLHGVRTYPDPTSTGLPKTSAQQLGVSSSKFQAAQRACQHLLPDSNSGGMTQAQKQQALRSYRNFTRCMRSHGVGNWPEPTSDSAGRAIFQIQGIDPGLPQISTTINACDHLVHFTMGSQMGPQYSAWPFMCSDTGTEPWSAGPCSRD